MRKFAFLLGVALAGQVLAAPLAFDPFNYTVGDNPADDSTDGDLVNNIAPLPVGEDWDQAGSSSIPSPVVTLGSLSYPVALQPPPTGNKITFGAPPTGVTGSRAERLNYPSQTTGSVFYSLIFQPTDLSTQTATATGGSFFASLNNGNVDAGTTSAPSVFLAKIALRRDQEDNADATKFNVGINNNAAAGSTVWDLTPRSVNDVLFALVQYQFGADPTQDVAKLWINPDPSAFDPATTIPSAQITGDGVPSTNRQLQSILVRQVGGLPTLNVDEIRVGTEYTDVFTVPEPSSLGVAGFAAMAFLRRRRA